MSVAVTTGQAQRDILAYVGQFGVAAYAWYCGIASNPRECLFIRHGVDEQNGNWIFCDCGTDAAARWVEQNLHSLGYKGASGGGGPDTRFVYAYRITSTTRE